MARILVADDDQHIRQLLTTILAGEGHEVLIACDGRNALEMIEAHPPDLVLLDIMMPEVDGYGVLKELKALGTRDFTKIVILTAKGAESDWLRGYKLGADHYLTKPFGLDELLDGVEEVLAMSKAELRARRDGEIQRAQLLTRLESLFDTL